MPQDQTIQELNLDEYKYGFVTEAEPLYRAPKGLSEEVVRQISKHKEEPQWMLDFRLKALKIYESKPMPTWGGDLAGLEQILDLRPLDARIDVLGLGRRLVLGSPDLVVDPVLDDLLGRGLAGLALHDLGDDAILAAPRVVSTHLGPGFRLLLGEQILDVLGLAFEEWHLGTSPTVFDYNTAG